MSGTRVTYCPAEWFAGGDGDEAAFGGDEDDREW